MKRRDRGYRGEGEIPVLRKERKTWKKMEVVSLREKGRGTRRIDKRQKWWRERGVLGSD